MKPRIGTAAWTIPSEFKKSFPEEGSHLERYSKVFNCVEINSSFNKIHLPRTYEKWALLTPPDFEFCIKLHRSFTHDCALKPSASKLKENLRDINNLGNKWKVLLLQFPGKMQFDANNMARFYEQIRKSFDGAIVLEPRNLSWLNPDSRKLMHQFKVSKVIADPERCPHKTKNILATAGITYTRLHGGPIIYRSSYSQSFLKKLSGELKGQQNPWVIFDNTSLGAATGNALKLQGIKS